MHPRRFPQIMFMDYKNILGQGNTACFVSSPKKHYYLKVADSLEEWIGRHLDMLEQ